MATPSQQSALPKSDQLKDLVDNLTRAKTLFGSPKAYARMALEDPRLAAEAAQAAKALTGPLRTIQTMV